MDQRIEPGAEIELSAGRFNRAADALEAARLVGVAGLLDVVQAADGRTLALPPDPCFWATLSGTASPYSFTEAVPQSGGTFATGSRTGSSAAYEVNGTGSLSGKVVRICPGYATDWRFYYRTRSTPDYDTISFPSCTGCTTVAARVALSNSSPSCVSCDNILPASTVNMTFQSTQPSGFGSLSIGPGWYADTTNVDAFGDTFYYVVTCESATATLNLTRAYKVNNTFGGGGPLLDSTRYTWSITGAGDSCSPFAMHGGIDGTSGCCTGFIHLDPIKSTDPSRFAPTAPQPSRAVRRAAGTTIAQVLPFP